MNSRVSLPPVSSYSDEELATYNRFPSNLARALLLTSDSANAHFDLGASFTRGLLSFVDREVIVIRVAELTSSAFEKHIHYPLALKAGLTEEEIAVVEAGRYSAMEPSREALVKYVSECIQGGGASLEAFERLKTFYDQREIAEVTHLAGHAWLTAMYLASLDIPVDEDETSWSNLDRKKK